MYLQKYRKKNSRQPELHELLHIIDEKQNGANSQQDNQIAQ